MFRPTNWADTLRELTVVFVGVLIALAVDNWNTRRGERQAEVKYLERIAADLRSDSATLADVYLDQVARKKTALDEVHAYASGSAAIGDTIAFIRQLGLGGIFGLARANFIRPITFNEMLSTGSFRLIRHEQLRSALVRHYADMEQQEERMNARKTGGYVTVVHGLYPAELRDSLTLERVRQAGLARTLIAVRSESFRSEINREMNLAIFAANILPAVRDATNTMLAAVTAEFDRLR